MPILLLTTFEFLNKSPLETSVVIRVTELKSQTEFSSASARNPKLLSSSPAAALALEKAWVS
jgi:hypothetical protein